jgi:hypothetical protein
VLLAALEYLIRAGSFIDQAYTFPKGAFNER